MTKTAAAPLSIAQALRGYSVEVNPNDPKMVDTALARVERGTEVFLTWIPGFDPTGMIEPAARLRSAGLIPVPHIGARHLESAAQLERLAASLAGEAGVDCVLMIGGDRAGPAGPYESTLAVMQTGALQKAGIVRMAVAGFPEGNPNIPSPALDEALAAKVAFARATGIQLSVVTQFCFEAEPIVAWLRQIRGREIDVLVRVGLAGPAGLLTLARYAARCGIGNSLRVLTENPSFAKLLMEKGPEVIIRGITTSTDSATPLSLPPGVLGLHFYVFGGLKTTLDWIDAERGC